MNYNKEVYELLEEHDLRDIGSVGYIFRHKKSGARLVLLANDDENKVFTIGFRTPPKDSTGVPHILEHSVLCGSKKYPAKDPFVELVKGSLNTFLNAITYPDKTIYPIASCNDEDFKNLTDVYMDAVLNPNIYTREQIFKQEGWHYELESVDAPLTYNGVVYNEMKGAFSSATGKLARVCMDSLYPDTSYGVESGGDPECIPDLSYEAFLGFHKKLYHPSNAYIYVYGNCDMEERLEYFDREYLSKYDEISVDSKINVQQAFDKPHRVEEAYSVTEEEGTENKTYLAYNASVGNSCDARLALAFSVLEYALFQTPGAPVKQALIDAGIGEDVDGYYDRSLLQPMVCITASNTNAEREEEFVQIIKESLRLVVADGINKDSLRAGINYNEFRYREADYGRFPKGLMYGIGMFDSWLHDDMKPFIHVECGENFEFLKRMVNTDYFEELVDKYLLNNNHSSVVVLKPEIGLSAKADERTAKKLAEYKATLSTEQLERIVEDTKALKKYQEEPSTKEELEAIPMLGIDDISKDILPYFNTEKQVSGVKVVHHNVNTNGIGYLRMSFDMKNVPDDMLQYAALLSNVLGMMSTDKYNYMELSNAIDINTGGINVNNDCVPLYKKSEQLYASIDVYGKSLYGDFEFMVNTMAEIIHHTHLDDYKRLKEIIGEIKMTLQGKFEGAGHSAAVSELLAQMSTTGAMKHEMTGVGYYRFLDDLYKNYDAKKEELVKKMASIIPMVFAKDTLTVSFTAGNRGYMLMEDELDKFISGLPQAEGTKADRKMSFPKQKIALKTGGQVDYVCRCGDYMKAGLSYHGSMRVLETIMSSDYLWTNVRVKGGAYGCMTGLGGLTSGKAYFVSYRDPNLKETNAIYEGVPEFVEHFEADDREMTKYIIGTISNIDIPKNPSAKGARSFEGYMRGISEDMLKAERAQIIGTTVSDIRNLAPQMKAILADDYFCVVGSEEKINANKELFDKIEGLI